jgi:hypothetical protein
MSIFPFRLLTVKLELKYRENIPIGKPQKSIGWADQAHCRMAVG